MMNTHSTTYGEVARASGAKGLRATGPFGWLRSGWNDLLATPGTSALLGGTFTLLCAAAYAAATALPMFSLTFVILLLLVSPFIAAAAYFTSSQLNETGKPALSLALGLVRSRAMCIGLFSLVLGLVAMAWVRLATIVFALYYGTVGVGAGEVARLWTASSVVPSLFIFILAASVVLALALFAISVMALPLISDQNVNPVVAMLSSLRVIRAHPLLMAVWMASILALVAAAFLTNLLLMPIVFPVLAFATWHGYQALMPQ